MIRRICDLKQEEIVVGLKLRSMIDSNCIGEIVQIDKENDNFAWIKWPHYNKPYGGFYGTNCKCEVVE